jgi:plasmid stabilization system protein ParE
MSLSSMQGRMNADPTTGIRELPFAPWPYIVGYKVIGDEVRIMYVRHGARDW